MEAPALMGPRVGSCKGSFRFCPSCGVEHNVRGSEFRKLCGLNSEGRSSATTTLSLSVLRQLLSFPERRDPQQRPQAAGLQRQPPGRLPAGGPLQRLRAGAAAARRPGGGPARPRASTS